MDDLSDPIECGVDILNPILPFDNMDFVQLKEKCGEDLGFLDGVDVEQFCRFAVGERSCRL